METKLRIAIQKKGRLYEDTMQLLSDCGIKAAKGQGRLISSAKNFPMEILFLRDDDIPGAVADGTADIGVVGENELIEKEFVLNVAHKLGFAKCRLSLAIPKSVDYNGIGWFNGKRIATSYPVILKQFLKKNKISSTIHEISGSVEIAPSIDMAEAIFDIVSSGSTLVSNGLKEVEEAMVSEAVLVSASKLNKEKKSILSTLLFRIKSVQEGKSNRYILMNVPNEKINDVCSILPGMKSPTIIPLAEKKWSSIHSVIKEGEFWNVIEQLKDNGAEGILVVPIEKMIL